MIVAVRLSFSDPQSYKGGTQLTQLSAILFLLLSTLGACPDAGESAAARVSFHSLAHLQVTDLLPKRSTSSLNVLAYVNLGSRESHAQIISLLL